MRIRTEELLGNFISLNKELTMVPLVTSKVTPPKDSVDLIGAIAV